MPWEISEDVERAADAIALNAHDGEVAARDVDLVLTRLQTPAVAYREVIAALADRGITVRAREVEDEDSLAPTPRRAVAGGHGGFGHFLRTAGSHEILTAEQEQELGKRIQMGDAAAEILAEHGPRLDASKRAVLERRSADGQAARNELVAHNVRLAVHVAKRHLPQIRGLSLEFEDIVQEAFLGLNRAAEKFDPTRGFKFSTYATWWLRQSISRAIADKGYLIRLPVHVHDSLSKVRKYVRRQEARRQSVDIEELTKLLDVPRERAEDLLLLASGGGVAAVRSLDIPVGDGDVTLGQLLEDDTTATTEARALEPIVSDELRRALEDKLTQREYDVLALRFGLDEHEEHTLEQVGEKFGLTRERIRQIQDGALKKLQHPKVLEMLSVAA